MMSYSTYEEFTYSTSHIHTILHNLRITPELPPPKREMHWHESIELIYVFQGVCTIHTDTNCTLIHPGELAIIHCNENHAVQSYTPLSHYYCLIIHPLDYDHLPFSLETTYFERIIKAPSIHNLFLSIADELNTHPPYFEFTAKSLITRLIIELLRNHTSKHHISTPSSLENPKTLLVKKAILYIRSHFTEKFSLEDLCLQIGVSKYYLCRIFKEVTNKTIIQFINELRCQYAQKLIYEHEYTIDQIAETCGFNSTPYFYRIYKKHIGITPLHINKAQKSSTF